MSVIFDTKPSQRKKRRPVHVNIITEKGTLCAEVWEPPVTIEGWRKLANDLLEQQKLDYESYYGHPPPED